MIKYKVILSWKCSFIFYDPDEAMKFAATAIKYRNPDDDTIEIKIEIILPGNVEEVEQND